MRLKKVKLGMTRIKVVLGERQRAYKQAKSQVRQLYEEARREQKKVRYANHIEYELARYNAWKQEQEGDNNSAAAQILSGETSSAPKI